MSEEKKHAGLRSARWFGASDLRAFGHRSRTLQMGYAYEDFMQGIRPVPGGGFELVEGRFLAFCRRATACQGPAVLILDEMNLARVERYLAPLLSAMETGEPIHLHIKGITAAIGRQAPRYNAVLTGIRRSYADIHPMVGIWFV